MSQRKPNKQNGGAGGGLNYMAVTNSLGVEKVSSYGKKYIYYFEVPMQFSCP